MLGAVIGDIIGSIHEFSMTKRTDFPLFHELSRFTDDTVLTVAVADCLLSGASYVDKFHEYTIAYPNRCYGSRFLHWVVTGAREPYNSWGNGSAMRVSPIGFAFDDLTDVIEEAKRSAEVTHNHPEGIKGAQAVAATILLARKGETKERIREEEDQIQEEADRTKDELIQALQDVIHSDTGLTPLQRQVIDLKLMEKSDTDIARIMGCSRQNVRPHFLRACRRLASSWCETPKGS